MVFLFVWKDPSAWRKRRQKIRRPGQPAPSHLCKFSRALPKPTASSPLLPSTNWEPWAPGLQSCCRRLRDGCWRSTRQLAGTVLVTRDPQMPKTQLGPHWGEGHRKAVITKRLTAGEGRTVLKEWWLGEAPSEEAIPGKTFPRTRVLYNECLCPTKCIC